MLKKEVLFAAIAVMGFSALWQVAASIDSSGSSSLDGLEKSAFSSPNKIDDMMKEAMQSIASIKQKQEQKKKAGEEEALLNLQKNNSTLQNTTLQNLTDENLTAQNTESEAGREKIGSSSKGSMSGVYGITASRHEIGKSNIQSKMVLNGTFEMDKSVKFQDQGF
jgi:hypothetical protein